MPEIISTIVRTMPIAMNIRGCEGRLRTCGSMGGCGSTGGCAAGGGSEGGFWSLFMLIIMVVKIEASVNEILSARMVLCLMI